MPALTGIDEKVIDKLRAMNTYGIEAVLIWGYTSGDYFSHSSSFGFRVFGLLDPQKYLSDPDCGKFQILQKYTFIVFLEMLNKFGERFRIRRDENRRNPEEVGWRVSAPTILTALRLLEKDEEQFEQTVELAKDRDEFIALAAVAEK